MSELIHIPVLPVVLSLVAFYIGSVCQKKCKLPAFNPILIGAVLVIVTLKLTGISNASYQAGMKNLSWLLTPATVCLAIPMYEQFQALRKNLHAVVVGVAAGVVSCLASVLLFSLVLGFGRNLTVSLFSKGITTAIGVTLTEMFGGTPSITTLGILVTGISGNMFGKSFCKWFGITDEVAQGVAFGTGAHVIGTAKANEIGSLCGAVSSLSLVVAGLMTALILPVLVSFM